MSAVVTNNHSAPLAVGGAIIRPGATVLITNWKVARAKPEVAQWLSMGLIEVAERDAPIEADGADDKPSIVAELEAAGVDVDRRLGVSRLREQLASLKELEAADAVSGADDSITEDQIS